MGFNSGFKGLMSETNDSRRNIHLLRPAIVLRPFVLRLFCFDFPLTNLRHFLKFAVPRFQVNSLWLAAFCYANPLISDGNIVFDLRLFCLTPHLFRIAAGA